MQSLRMSAVIFVIKRSWKLHGNKTKTTKKKQKAGTVKFKVFSLPVFFSLVLGFVVLFFRLFCFFFRGRFGLDFSCLGLVGSDWVPMTWVWLSREGLAWVGLNLAGLGLVDLSRLFVMDRVFWL